MKKISTFKGEYEFLSNFYHAPMIINDVVYPTVEHFFQSKKAGINKEYWLREILLDNNPSYAKSVGRCIPLRSDWEKIKNDVMYKGLQYKFSQHHNLKRKLIETGDAELVEGNNWNDTYWGVCKGIGKNQLGKLLMKLRSLIKSGV